MTYTLRGIAERIIRDFSGGDIPADSPYSFPFVIAHVRDALRENLKLELLQRRGNGEDDRTPIAQYIATYPDRQIQYDGLEAWVGIPSNYMSMKWNKGIHAVIPKNSLKRMIPVSNPGVTAHLMHADLEGSNYGFYVEGLKIKFMRNPLSDNINYVTIKLIVPAPDTWGDNDALPVVPENIMAVIDRVKQAIRPIAPQDRLNDNNPNLRANNG